LRWAEKTHRDIFGSMPFFFALFIMAVPSTGGIEGEQK
jgi:hypothetical protein